MTTFLLIALMTLGNGEVHEYVLDHGLSYEDCRGAVAQGLKFDGPPKRSLSTAELVCRVEDAAE